VRLFYFTDGDSGAALRREWGAFRDTSFGYKKGETWDRLVHQGVLLQRLAQDSRIRISHPNPHLLCGLLPRPSTRKPLSPMPLFVRVLCVLLSKRHLTAPERGFTQERQAISTVAPGRI